MMSKQDMIARRIEICSKCPLLQKGWPGDRCRECGCYVEVRARNVEVPCPLLKWPTAREVDAE